MNPFGATGFSIGTKGYLYSNNTLRDFFEFNPATHTWTAIANFPGYYRSNAVGFNIGTKGYVGTGFIEDIGGVNDFGNTLLQLHCLLLLQM